MIKVGLTGGIGSGKSTVCELFSILGIPAYCSDIRAQQLMVSNEEIINTLKQTFGNDVYLSNGMLHKEKLTKLVFESTDTRQTINNIVHPVVAKDFIDWCSKQSETVPYVIQESALLFESEQWKQLDKVITVTCPFVERIERIMKRDNCSETMARNKINSQLPEEEKAAKSTYCIESSSSNLIIQNVLNIHQQLITTQQ
jgi:dephospho-CoA kinase